MTRGRWIIVIGVIGVIGLISDVLFE